MTKKTCLAAMVLLCVIVPFFISSCRPSDSKVQAAVEKALKKDPSKSGVTASVQNGVVTLTGEVSDENSKAAIEAEIGQMSGVKQVINNCTVMAAQTQPAPVTISPDETLIKNVNDAIKDYPGVHATVNNGVVTLTGEIKRADLQKLMMSLQSLRPKKIDNQLTIT